MWIAKEAYVAPLQPNWEEFYDDAGRIYFSNRVTGQVFSLRLFEL